MFSGQHIFGLGRLYSNQDAMLMLDNKKAKCPKGTALQRAQNVMSNKNIDHPMLILECHHHLVHWSLWKKAQYPLSKVAEARLPIACLTHCRCP